MATFNGIKLGGPAIDYGKSIIQTPDSGFTTWIF